MALSDFLIPGSLVDLSFNISKRAREQRQKMNLESLAPFISRNIISQEQVPFMADTFSQGDPFREADLNQLREQGMGGLSSVQEVVRQQPGFFDEQQAQQLSSLFSGPQGPEQLTQLVASRMMPQSQDPTGLMQNLAAAGLVPGTKEYQDAMLQAVLKPQTQINMGDMKPLGNDASTWFNDRGENPDPRLPPGTAASLGFRPENPDKRKAVQAAQEAAPIFSGLMKYGFGDDPLFPPADSSMLGRGIGGAQAWLKGKTDSDLRISLYNSSKNAVVTGLARLAGQVGTLTDRDVDTVAGLLPVAGLTPEPVAKEKFRQIGMLLKGKGLSDQMLKDLGFPDWALSTGSVKLPPGWVKE